MITAENLCHEQAHDIDVGFDHGLERIALLWPHTIVHVIDEYSPLYTYDKHKLAASYIEIIVHIHGDEAAVGQGVTVRTSYTSNEIIWGYRCVIFIFHDC